MARNGDAEARRFLGHLEGQGGAAGNGRTQVRDSVLGQAKVASMTTIHDCDRGARALLSHAALGVRVFN